MARFTATSLAPLGPYCDTAITCPWLPSPVAFTKQTICVYHFTQWQEGDSMKYRIGDHLATVAAAGSQGTVYRTLLRTKTWPLWQVTQDNGIPRKWRLKQPWLETWAKCPTCSRTLKLEHFAAPAAVCNSLLIFTERYPTIRQFYCPHWTCHDCIRKAALERVHAT